MFHRPPGCRVDHVRVASPVVFEKLAIVARRRDGRIEKCHRHRKLALSTRGRPLLRHAPQYAIWDDRDFGPSDSDRTFPLREASGAIFERYWANPSYGSEPGLDGIWSSFEAG